MAEHYRIGFLGCGNMGTAILGGILNAGLADRDEVIASVHTEASVQRLKAAYPGMTVVTDNREAAKADTVFLAVKPDQAENVLNEVRDVIQPETILISVVAKKTISDLENALTALPLIGKLQLVRCMPNTPARVGEGMTAVTPAKTLTEQNLQYVLRLLGSFGKAEVVPESLMDCVTGVSGSAPAFIYILIEAMADAAVLEGMKRPQAYEFAAQTVLGSAKMVLKTGLHPAELKDQVCSPAGTTIAGVEKLEENGFRNAVIQAVKAAVEKSRG